MFFISIGDRALIRKRYFKWDTWIYAFVRETEKERDTFNICDSSVLMMCFLQAADSRQVHLTQQMS